MKTTQQKPLTTFSSQQAGIFSMKIINPVETSFGELDPIRLNSDNTTIKILYDSTAINNKFKTGWGFSCWINDHIIFDTGTNGKDLLNNIQLMNVSLADIDKIIISHEHYDHIGGMWEILEKNKNISTYICPNFTSSFKNRVKSLRSSIIESKLFQEIVPNIFTTGEMSGVYKNQFIPEQSVIIKTQKGLVIITGCAHPGIVSILNKIKNTFPNDKIYWVIGGFHLRNADQTTIEKIANQFKKLNIEKVSPIHCSGKKTQDIFEKTYKVNLIKLKVGDIIEI